MIFPSHGLNALDEDGWVASSRAGGRHRRPVHRLRAWRHVCSLRSDLLARCLRRADGDRLVHRGQALVAVPPGRVGPPRTAATAHAPGLLGVHRQRPGDRHDRLRLRLPAGPVDHGARPLRHSGSAVGRPGRPLLGGQRPASVPRVLHLSRPGARIPPQRRHVPATAGLDRLRRHPGRGTQTPRSGSSRACRHRPPDQRQGRGAS